jgi:glutamyl-tRNA synthetase
MLKEYLAASPFAGKHFDDEYLITIIGAMRERATFVKDFVEKCAYFYQAPDQYEPDVVKKRWKPETPDQLKILAEEFSRMENPKKEEYESALHRIAESLKIKQGDLIHPLRLAVSGMGAGPGLYDILVILGKDETLRRIHLAIERMK